MTTNPHDQANFNQINRDRWVARMAKELPPGTRVLDVGAGPCPYRSLFAHCEYKTQDFGQFQGMREGLFRGDWSYGRLDYVCDAQSIPVPDGSFDAILCTEVLEHVPDPAAVLREIGRILKPGGRAFITAPLGSGLHQQPYHYFGGFTPHFYREFLPKAGLDVVHLDPNGLFFRLLMQEMLRGAAILREHKKYPAWHPMRWVVRMVRHKYFVNWMSRLDDALPISEFTVGYFVEAIKRSAAPSPQPDPPGAP